MQPSFGSVGTELNIANLLAQSEKIGCLHGTSLPTRAHASLTTERYGLEPAAGRSKNSTTKQYDTRGGCSTKASSLEI